MKGNLTLTSGSSAATLGTNATVNSNLTVSTGTLDLSAFTANRATSGGTLTVSNGATLMIGGTNGFPANFTPNTLGTTSTVNYSGTTQSVAVKSYGHLTISGGSTKTLAGNSNVAGQLTQFTDGSSPWSISSSANGSNVIRAQYSTTGSSGPWSDVSGYDSDFSLAPTVAPGSAVTVWLRIQTPTHSSTFVQHASTLKVCAR